MKNDQQEKTMYLLKYMDDYIESLIYKVIDDCKEDPHYSAITASNLLKCYIDVMLCNNYQLPYQNIKEYFDYNLLSSDQYRYFQEKIEIESKYYVGKIY